MSASLSKDLWYYLKSFRNSFKLCEEYSKIVEELNAVEVKEENANGTACKVAKSSEAEIKAKHIIITTPLMINDYGGIIAIISKKPLPLRGYLEFRSKQEFDKHVQTLWEIKLSTTC